MIDLLEILTAPPIPRLLFLRSPAHIAGLVITIIVDAINRVIFRRLAAHVFQERAVTILPSLTDGNPASAIVCEAWKIRVEASLQHHSPAMIFRRAVSFFIVAMFYPSCSVRFCVQASAASVISRTHIIGAYDFRVAAIALTQDALSRFTVCEANWIGNFQDDKPSEAFSDHSFGGNDVASHRTPHCPWLEPLRRLPVSAARCFAGAYHG